MFSSLTTGAVLGLSAGFAPGPLTTLVVAQTLKHDFREGFKVALAPLITDLPIILISFFIMAQMDAFERLLGALALGGGLYVLYLGYESLAIRPVRLEITAKAPRSLQKGILANLLNPHPYLFWITVGGPLFIKLSDEHPLAPAVFIGCFYFLLVGSKVFLAFLIGRSKSFLASSGYLWLMRLLGAMLVVFALILIKDALKLLGVWS